MRYRIYLNVPLKYRNKKVGKEYSLPTFILNLLLVIYLKVTFSECVEQETHGS